MAKSIIYILFCILIFSLLSACSNENSSPTTPDQKMNITQISSKQPFDQGYANKAKKKLANKEYIEKVVAVNTDKLLIIAIEIPHHERFKLSKYNKELSKEMDKEFENTNITVELVTDKKILWELQELETKLKKQDISKKELEKKLKHISKLLKEQT